MLFGIAAIVFGLWHLVNTERCRRNPPVCKDMFITEGGFHFSIVGFAFMGKPKQGREEIVHNWELRYVFLAERYATGLFLLGGGIYLLFSS